MRPTLSAAHPSRYHAALALVAVSAYEYTSGQRAPDNPSLALLIDFSSSSLIKTNLDKGRVLKFEAKAKTDEKEEDEADSAGCASLEVSCCPDAPQNVHLENASAGPQHALLSIVCTPVAHSLAFSVHALGPKAQLWLVDLLDCCTIKGIR